MTHWTSYRTLLAWVERSYVKRFDNYSVVFISGWWRQLYSCLHQWLVKFCSWFSMTPQATKDSLQILWLYTSSLILTRFPLILKFPYKVPQSLCCSNELHWLLKIVVLCSICTPYSGRLQGDSYYNSVIYTYLFPAFWKPALDLSIHFLMSHNMENENEQTLNSMEKAATVMTLRCSSISYTIKLQWLLDTHNHICTYLLSL